MKSTDSLVDVNNRYDGLTDEEEGEVLGPSTKVLPIPQPTPAKRQSLTSALLSTSQQANKSQQVQQQQPLAGFPGPETSTPKAAMGTATRAPTSTLAETRIGTRLSTAQIQCYE
jgi:hypothetical protein